MKKLFRHTYPVFYLSLLMTTLFSCEKIIDVDLNDASPKLVVEAKLLAGTNLFDVHITQTSSYFDSEETPIITNAEVTLWDENGEPIDIPYLTDGHYQTMITAEAANTYKLDVKWNEETYTASSYLPEVVAILDLRSEETESVGLMGGGNNSGTEYMVYCIFDDPAHSENFYQIKYNENGEPSDKTVIQILSDRSSDGEQLDFPIANRHTSFKSGDTISVHLISMDESAYTYQLSLSDIVSSGGNPIVGSVAPGNPISNWSGGILGHFTAYDLDTMDIVIP